MGGAAKRFAEGVDVLAREDLIPLDRRTKEEQKRIATAGGIASGVARRRKRSLKEAADLYLSLPPTDRRNWNKLARRGLAPDEIDNQMAIIVGITDRAAKGDAKAAKVLIDLLGERPEDGADDDEKVEIIIDV